MKRILLMLILLLALPMSLFSVTRVYYEEPDTIFVPEIDMYEPREISEFEFKEYTFRNPKNTISMELMDIMKRMAKDVWSNTYSFSFLQAQNYVHIVIEEADLWFLLNYTSDKSKFMGVYQIRTNKGLRKFIIINKGGEATQKRIDFIFKPTNKLLCYKQKVKIIESTFVIRDYMAKYKGFLFENEDELFPMEFFILRNKIYPREEPIYNTLTMVFYPIITSIEYILPIIESQRKPWKKHFDYY